MLAALLISAAALLADAEPAENPFDRTIQLRPALADGANAPHPLALAVPTYDRVQGDATPIYSQAFLMLPRTYGDDLDESFADQVNTALEQEPGDLDRDLHRMIAKRYESSLDLASVASRRSQAGMHTTVREFGVAALLPQLNPAREVANALRLRANLAADEGRWDDWLSDVTTMIRLSQQIADHDDAVLVEGLVAAAIGGLALDTIHKADSVPDRPNLYWSLLAVDFDLDLLALLQAETLWIEASLPELADPEAMTADRFVSLLARVNELTEFAGDGAGPLARMASNTATTAFMLAQARAWLLENTDFVEADLDAMSPFEVIAHYLGESVDQAYAELFRITLMPLPEAIDAAEAFDERIQDPSYGSLLVQVLMPSVTRARVSLVRLDRERDGLIVIEALRDHVARFDELPDTLDAVELPLPRDPGTGEPFGYERLGENEAVLRAEHVDGFRDRDSWTWKLEVAGE
ncbi:MAG: hypothetical protein AAGI46_14920 [Planctomycetota bacterium]